MDSIEDFDQCRDGSFAPINRFAVVTCLARRQSWMHAPYVQISMCPPEDPGFGVLGFWGLGWLRFSLRDDLAISSQTGGFRFRCYLMVIRPPSAIVASICQVVISGIMWHPTSAKHCFAGGQKQRVALARAVYANPVGRTDPFSSFQCGDDLGAKDIYILDVSTSVCL